MKKTTEDVAKELASAHREEDPDTQAIYLAKAPPDEVHLVEVSGSVGTGSDGGEMLPFRFAAQGGVPYPSAVVLLSPDEWKLVEGGKLKLPEGWGDVSTLKKIA